MTGGGAAPRVTPAERRRRGPRRAVAVALVAATTAALLAVGWAVWEHSGGDGVTFEVVDHATGEVAFARPIATGETFRLEHTHSVTGRLVIETFSVLDDGIGIEELWFDAFGANLPTGPERMGDHVTTFLEEDGAYRVLHHGYPIGTLPLRVGSEPVDHTLIFEDGHELRLLDVARAGAHVELRVRPR